MYEFTEDCMIHIPQIDEEHRKLFQIIMMLFPLLKQPKIFPELPRACFFI